MLWSKENIRELKEARDRVREIDSYKYRVHEAVGKELISKGICDEDDEADSRYYVKVKDTIATAILEHPAALEEVLKDFMNDKIKIDK